MKRTQVRRYLSPEKQFKCPMCDNNVLVPNAQYCSLSCSTKARYDIKPEEIINGSITSRATLKRFLIKDRGHCCESCGFSEWEGKQIPIILDHINGDSDNNQIDNLRLICPNCDALSPFYRGRNKGRGRVSKRKAREAALSSETLPPQHIN